MRAIRFAVLPLPGVLAVALAAVLLLFGLRLGLAPHVRTVQTEPQSAFPRAVVGQPAPDVTLQFLDGGTFDLSSLRDEPVVLYFWATWCRTCADDLMRLNNLVSPSSDLRLVAINIMEPVDTVRDFISEHRFPQSILLDITGQAARRYDVRATPTYYFLDAEGTVTGRIIGPARPAALEGHLRRIQPRSDEHQQAESRT